MNFVSCSRDFKFCSIFCCWLIGMESLYDVVLVADWAIYFRFSCLYCVIIVHNLLFCFSMLFRLGWQYVCLHDCATDGGFNGFAPSKD